MGPLLTLAQALPRRGERGRRDLRGLRGRPRPAYPLSRMLKWFARQYARRVVNVNVNILIAGVLALGPVLLILELCDYLKVDRQWLPVVTFTADVLCDLVAYYFLHFLANHAGRPAQQLHSVADASISHTPFFKDATKVQFQRMVLSPLLYALWLGTQWVLVHRYNVSVALATTTGFGLGVLSSRILHTLWLLSEERQQLQKARAAAVSPEPSAHPSADPPGPPAGPPAPPIVLGLSNGQSSPTGAVKH